MKITINSKVSRKPVLRLTVSKKPFVCNVRRPQRGYSIGGLSIPAYAGRHRERLLEEMVYRTIEKGLLNLSQEQVFVLLDKALFLNEREEAFSLAQLLFRKERQIKAQIEVWEGERGNYND